MIRSIQEYIDTPLLREHWYVAGSVEEFTQEPTARTLLERSIVFYRSSSGELSAMQNRCLHRSYPLSESELDGDNLVCSYHGACYAPDGTLVRVPSQASAPVPKRSLRTYPVREVGPFVFIWMATVIRMIRASSSSRAWATRRSRCCTGTTTSTAATCSCARTSTTSRTSCISTARPSTSTTRSLTHRPRSRFETTG